VLFDARLSSVGPQLFHRCSDGDGLDVLEPEVVVIALIEEALYARAYAIRVLRLRMVAVKNSMKRRPARSPWARIIAGSVSSPARTSAGGGTQRPERVSICPTAVSSAPHEWSRKVLGPFKRRSSATCSGLSQTAPKNNLKCGRSGPDRAVVKGMRQFPYSARER
jgi:hypothetical protein